jgi:hypothetical protein
MKVAPFPPQPAKSRASREILARSWRQRRTRIHRSAARRSEPPSVRSNAAPREPQAAESSGGVRMLWGGGGGELRTFRSEARPEEGCRRRSVVRRRGGRSRAGPGAEGFIVAGGGCGVPVRSRRGERRTPHLPSTHEPRAPPPP